VPVGAFYQYSDRYGDNPGLPGALTVVVEPGVAHRSRVPVILAASLPREGNVAALWVDGFSPAEVDSKVPANPGVPVLGYIDTRTWGAPPTRVDWVGVQAYRLRGEPLAVFDARVRGMLQKCRKAVPVVQAYGSNADNDPDIPRAQWDLYYEWAQEPNVTAVLVFSDGRPTGMRDHPEWRAEYERLVKRLGG
jgi:hypothetical protein